MCCLSKSPFRLEAIAIPKAAEIEVEVACQKRHKYSRFFWKPDIPAIVCSYEIISSSGIFMSVVLDAPRPKSINHRGVKYSAGNGEFDNA
jgi:hypothetical protein